ITNPQRQSTALILWSTIHPISTRLPYTTLFRSLRSSGSRGAERAIPKGPAFRARLRGADAGAAEGLPVPLCRPGVSASKARSKRDRKSTRLNSSHDQISYAVFCLKKKIKEKYAD